MIADKFDKFIGNKFVFKVNVKVYDNSMMPSLNVVRFNDEKENS